MRSRCISSWSIRRGSAMRSQSPPSIAKQSRDLRKLYVEVHFAVRRVVLPDREFFIKISRILSRQGVNHGDRFSPDLPTGKTASDVKRRQEIFCNDLVNVNLAAALFLNARGSSWIINSNDDVALLHSQWEEAEENKNCVCL